MIMAARPVLVVLVTIVILAALSGIFLWRAGYQTHFILRTRPGVILGSNASGPYSPVGWQMPSDTLISTSYVANQSFDLYYMNAYVNVLSSSSYQLQPGTALSFGLYINDRFMGTRVCTTDNPNGSGGWASVGTLSNGSYMLTTLECGVTLFKTPFPAGSVLTVTVWSNHPIWIQVDSSPTTCSYETSNVTSSYPMSSVNPMAGIVAPRTITIDAYSD